MIKTRVRSFPDKNYWAVFNEGETVRFVFDPTKPIGDLEYPEFYDFKVTDICSNGKCPWCYMSSAPEGKHYKNIVKKFRDFFEPMNMNQRPFQIAYGGGEPTEHPEFINLLKETWNFGIMPNYTTNGTTIRTQDGTQNKDLLNATFDFCGGVAMSTHPHLEKYWRDAVDIFITHKKVLNSQLKVNLHHIVSGKESIQRMVAIYQEFKDMIDYLVVLPMVAQGRATTSFDEEEFLFDTLRSLDSLKQFAFGAKLYPALLRAKEAGKPLPVALYEPEIMSKFIDMKDMKVYPSSFDLAILYEKET